MVLMLRLSTRPKLRFTHSLLQGTNEGRPYSKVGVVDFALKTSLACRGDV